MRKHQKTTETPNNNAVAYLRYSSTNQRAKSLSGQEKQIRDFAAKNGFNIIEVYSDAAKSGTNADREAFLRMIQDSVDKKFGYVIVQKLDRFSRDKYDSAIYKRKLNKNGVSVISVLEKLSDDPESIGLKVDAPRT